MIDKRILKLKESFPEIDLLMNAVDEELFISPEDLCSTNRESFIVYGRMIFTFLLRQESGLPLKKIGLLLNRTHATILYHISSYEDNYKYNKRFKKMADKVINKYKQLKSNYDGLV